MRKIRGEVVWISVAFLLLCIVSAYRQISIRFLPGDPARSFIGYSYYLILLLIWWRSVCGRVTQTNMRRFLQIEQILMLIGITVCLLIDVFKPYYINNDLQLQNTFIMRFTGYAANVPMMLIPLFGLYASFGLGKTEEYRFDKKWYSLLIPAIIIVIATLTNESHHFVFLPWEDAQSNLYYIPNIGLYIIVAFAFILLFIRIFVLFFKSREPLDYKRWRIVPFLVAVLMVLYNIPHIMVSFSSDIGLFEYHALLFFLEAILWESCILTGMIPVNTRYEEVFDRSTVAMQIIGNDGRLRIKSSQAPELPEETFGRLKQDAMVRTQDGQELHLHTIRSGYAVWQSDVSETLAVIDELQKIAEVLELEGDILRQELIIRSDEATVREQNRIYNRLTDEIGGQLLMLRDLLDKRDLVADKAGLFKKICVIGTYIKRRCCLRLIEQSDGKVTSKDLELCYLELTGCLSQMGVAVEVFWETIAAPDPEFAIFTLDVFELLLEHERFEMSAVKVTFETESALTIQVYCGGGVLGGSGVTGGGVPGVGNIVVKIPVEELRRISGEKHTANWQALENGYRISVINGGD